MTTYRRAAAAAAAAGALLLTATPALAQPLPPPTSTPFATPSTDACPHRDVPPPAVDASEVPEPGRAAPAPLPVPADPVGGPRLAACGVVAADGTPPVPDDISATSWTVSDLDSGAVVAAKDPHGRYRPASTIKVLLALVVLDELDLDRSVVATAEEANIIGSAVGIGEGGVYTVRQLMQGLVMASGNDAAQALSTQLGGVEATLEKMNAKADDLGALDTRAATPSGLDAPGMSSSAYDLALIFRAAMEQPVFRELVTTESVEFPGYPRDPSRPENPAIEGNPGIGVDPTQPVNEDRPGFTLSNDNQLLYNYPGAIGGKNGYTDNARQTFVGAAERNGRRLVVTLLDADVLPIRPWEQAARLLDFGFAAPDSAAVGELVDPGSATETTTGSATPTTAPPTTTSPTTGSVPSARSAGSADDESDLAVRVGVGVLGLIVVVGLVLWARKLSRG